MTEIRKVFHEELDDIRDDVVRLAAMVGESIEAGTAALLDADLAAVESVIAADEPIDDLTHSIEERAFLLLAQQQPVASDMRMLVTVLRIIHETERIGDLMVKVAKAARRLYPHSLDPRVRGTLDRMREQAGAQLRLAIDAFATRDVAKAAALADMDDVMDDLQKNLFRIILAHQEGAGADAELQRAVQIALVGRFFERIGDHAANIAERVQFMVTGRFPREEHDADL